MSAPSIQKEHAVETYKSLIQISVEGMKLLAVFNGGAAVALLSYLGNLAGKNIPVPNMKCSMGCFLAGLFCCGACFITSYLTQLNLYQESMEFHENNSKTNHACILKISILFAVLSILFFAIGSYSAVVNFK